MHQTKKRKTWHFGMKAHVGTDLQGIVHSLTTTAAHVADITQLPQLLHGAERVLHGDQAYWSAFHQQCAEAHGVHYRVNRRGTRHRPLTAGQRARGEHAFQVVKRL